MSTDGTVFFVLACARSGSTSLARILDGASNGICRVEPAPNLNFETREMMDGRLDDPERVIESLVAPRIAAGLTEVRVYGEKNLTYGPFIGHLYRRFHCRFVLLVRDGPNVVRSLMDWHNNLFGSVYRECRDPGRLTPRAISAAANLPVHLDMSDYSRPRPPLGTPDGDRWEHFTREEMCAWYWAHLYDLYLAELEKLPAESWIRIDYRDPAADDILRVAAFLGLEGLGEEAVRTQLDSRINSLADRGAEGERYPDWPDWPGWLQERFTEIAGPTTGRLGLTL